MEYIQHFLLSFNQTKSYQPHKHVKRITYLDFTSTNDYTFKVILPGNKIHLAVAFFEKMNIIRIILIIDIGDGLIMNNLNIDIARASSFNMHPFAAASENRIIDTELLFENGDVVFIQHQGEQYHLRRTRNGKLILTK